MTQEQFVYWLQGKLEGRGEVSNDEIKIIKDHLETVFYKVTPIYPQTHLPRDNSTLLKC